MNKKTPEQIAEEIVEWFPHSAFTYDTYKKLKRDIAAAIKAERETNDTAIFNTGKPV